MSAGPNAAGFHPHSCFHSRRRFSLVFRRVNKDFATRDGNIVLQIPAVLNRLLEIVIEQGHHPSVSLFNTDSSPLSCICVLLILTRCLTSLSPMPLVITITIILITIVLICFFSSCCPALSELQLRTTLSDWIQTIFQHFLLPCNFFWGREILTFWDLTMFVKSSENLRGDTFETGHYVNHQLFGLSLRKTSIPGTSLGISSLNSA